MMAIIFQKKKIKKWKETKKKMEKEYTFNAYNNFCDKGISQALCSINNEGEQPIIICIGSDLVLGDSLGPLVGTMIKNKNIAPFIYGTLNYPVTAKEVNYAKKYLKEMHPFSKLIAIDAGIGDSEDVGKIKVVSHGLKPGLGVNKDLDFIGDISIIGIVAKKSEQNYSLYNATRLSLIYQMSEVISNGIIDYIKENFCKNL